MPGSPADCPPERGAALDAELRRLHASGASLRLSALHEEAAGMMPDRGARRFHLTHAWVFALEAGDEARVVSLERTLRSIAGL